MADFNFTVDTQPMAHSIGTVSNSVNTVSLAVTAMEAAVIAAEQEGSQHVCRNVDEGFFLLIRSQISQKTAYLSSEATSRLMSLRQLALALKGIRRQMERDYHMISSRYKKLFATLDKSLQQRIFELDKTPSDLASRQYPNLISRLRNSGAGFLTNQNEIIPLGQYSASAKFKMDTDNLIKSMHDNLKEQAVLKVKLSHSLNNEKIAKRQSLCVPVLITEADGLGGLGTVSVIHTPLFGGNLSSADDKIKENLSHSSELGHWADVRPEEKSKVVSEVQSFCASSKLSARVQTEIMRLVNTSSWQCLQKKGV